MSDGHYEFLDQGDEQTELAYARTYPEFPCEHEGCDRPGEPCCLNAWDDADKGAGPNGYYCSRHAHEHGFCYLCGLFQGGTESFDFSDGLCDNCRESSDWDDGGEDDDDPDRRDDPLYGGYYFERNED